MTHKSTLSPKKLGKSAKSKISAKPADSAKPVSGQKEQGKDTREASLKHKIAQLEQELATTKYNKATQHHIGLVKAKLAQLREKLRSGTATKKGEGFAVKKAGDATVVFLGFPSVGKSTLLNHLTNAQSETAQYSFTTLEVVPGMMDFQGAKIQLLDVPGILEGAAAGTGRGREVLAILRSADLILILLDASQPKKILLQLHTLLQEVFDAGLRLNQSQLDISLVKKERGGLRLLSTVKQELTQETIKEVLKQFKIANADLILRQKISLDQLIDFLQSNTIYLPGLVVINKKDLLSPNQLAQLRVNLKKEFAQNPLLKLFPLPIFISAHSSQNLDQLRKGIFKALQFIRVHTRDKNLIKDKTTLKHESRPLILKKGANVRQACLKVHQDFVKKFKSARLWGPSAKFPGQEVGLDHVLQDGDLLELSTS